MTVSHILAVLSSSDLVIDVEIIEMNVEPKTQSLRAKATLKKGYVLYVNEGIGEYYRRYSYHLQKDDEMKMFEDRIIIDPEIRHGKPVIKGTRVPIDLRTVYGWMCV